jgi:hypothetical protein
VNTILPLIATLARTLANQFATSGFLTPVLDKILLSVAVLIERGEAGVTELQVLTQQIDAMVSAGREPTSQEWSDLIARASAAHNIIQNTPL